MFVCEKAVNLFFFATDSIFFCRYESLLHKKKKKTCVIVSIFLCYKTTRATQIIMITTLKAMSEKKEKLSNENN